VHKHCFGFKFLRRKRYFLFSQSLCLRVIDLPNCPTTARNKEYIRYIRTDSPTSAYVLHTLNNKHEYCPAKQTLKLVKACNNGIKMNCWETVYIQTFHKHNTLTAEQQVNNINPLFQLAYTTRDLLRVP